MKSQGLFDLEFCFSRRLEPLSMPLCISDSTTAPPTTLGCVSSFASGAISPPRSQYHTRLLIFFSFSFCCRKSWLILLDLLWGILTRFLSLRFVIEILSIFFIYFSLPFSCLFRLYLIINSVFEDLFDSDWFLWYSYWMISMWFLIPGKLATDIMNKSIKSQMSGQYYGSWTHDFTVGKMISRMDHNGFSPKARFSLAASSLAVTTLVVPIFFPTWPTRMRTVTEAHQIVIW